MRFLPRTKVIQQNLDLNIVNIEKAIDSLFKEKFTGYVLFAFDEDHESLLFIEKGNLMSQLFFSPDKIMKDKEAKDELSAWKAKGEGKVDFIFLNDKAYNIMQSIFFGESYFGLLESSYIKFSGLVDQLREDKLDGCLTLDGERDNVILFLTGGKPTSVYFRGYNIKNGSKSAIAKLIQNHNVEIEFFTRPSKIDHIREARKALIEDKKETLNLQKVIQDGQVWFEDQYGNKYKKSQIKDLWGKYHLVL